MITTETQTITADDIIEVIPGVNVNTVTIFVLDSLAKINSLSVDGNVTLKDSTGSNIVETDDISFDDVSKQNKFFVGSDGKIRIICDKLTMTDLATAKNKFVGSIISYKLGHLIRKNTEYIMCAKCGETDIYPSQTLPNSTSLASMIETFIQGLDPNKLPEPVKIEIYPQYVQS